MTDVTEINLAIIGVRRKNVQRQIQQLQEEDRRLSEWEAQLYKEQYAERALLPELGYHEAVAQWQAEA